MADAGNGASIWVEEEEEKRDEDQRGWVMVQLSHLTPDSMLRIRRVVWSFLFQLYALQGKADAEHGLLIKKHSTYSD